jgi:hypothetical protein
MLERLSFITISNVPSRSGIALPMCKFCSLVEKGL